MQNFSETTHFLWSVADLIRDTFKRGKYQDVILPFTVLRRYRPAKAAPAGCGGFPLSWE